MWCLTKHRPRDHRTCLAGYAEFLQHLMQERFLHFAHCVRYGRNDWRVLLAERFLTTLATHTPGEMSNAPQRAQELDSFACCTARVHNEANGPEIENFRPAELHLVFLYGQIFEQVLQLVDIELDARSHGGTQIHCFDVCAFHRWRFDFLNLIDNCGQILENAHVIE